MGVFHIFKIVSMVSNRAKYHNVYVRRLVHSGLEPSNISYTCTKITAENYFCRLGRNTFKMTNIESMHIGVFAEIAFYTLADR